MSIIRSMSEARKKNENLIAFRIPRDLSVTLRKMGVNPIEVCLKVIYEITGKTFFAQLQTKKNSFQACS